MAKRDKDLGDEMVDVVEDVKGLGRGLVRTGKDVIEVPVEAVEEAVDMFDILDIFEEGGPTGSRHRTVSSHKWGKIGAPGSTKRKQWMRTIRNR